MAARKSDTGLPEGLKRRDVVSSLERGLLVLTAFDHDAVRMTPSDVAVRTGLPRAVTRRILLTLCKMGYASSDGKYFRLTPKVLDLSHNYLRSDKINDLIEPVMQSAVDVIKDSCTLHIRDGADCVSILACNAASFGAVNVGVGLRIPLYVATPGRVMLAEMPDAEVRAYLKDTALAKFTDKTVVRKTDLLKNLSHIREVGYAVGREEWELGVYAVSVPIRSEAKAFAGCLTFVGNVVRIQDDNELQRRINVLRRAALQIGALLPKSVRMDDSLNLTASG